MKIIYCIAICLLMGNMSHSQILKKVLNDAKNHAESKIRSKAIQKTDQAIDSLMKPSQKTDKKSKENSTTTSNEPKDQISTGNSSSGEGSGEMGVGEGFVQLSVSADEVFKGGTVVITGSSVSYGDMKTVKMQVTGNGQTETATLTLRENGSFAVGWQSKEVGLFTITVISSDGKDKTSKQVKVTEMELIDWCDNNIEETQRALAKLTKEAAKVKQSIGQKDRQQLEQKLKELEQNTQAAMTLFTGLNNAIKQVSGLVTKGAVLPRNLTDNLSQLNDQLASQHKEMQQMNDAVEHEPYDNSICEYIVMVNEALAAFSTFTNLWAKTVGGVIKNIVLDKAAPKAVEMINSNTVQASAPAEFMGKEASKIFLTSQLDMESLTSKIGKAGIAGDVGQFLTEVLLKTYCGIFKGELSHTYTIIYRNKDNIIWWQYSYTTQSAVTFRYPKSSSGGIIKMKGNIEGNATSFRFTEDMEEEDGFKEKMKTHRTMNHIPVWGPKSVPFSSAQSDALGFGAVARGIATPACFNIPVDAEYDTDAGTIKLTLNEALIDFTDLVKYTYVFIKFSLSGIPLFARVDFPINKVKPTLNAVVSRNNQLTVTKDAKNNLLVKGGGERHIGSESESIEHKIIYSLTAKNDN